MSGRLAAWWVLVGIQILLAYASRLSEGKPPPDAVYRYSLAVGGLIQYGIVLAVVLLIARGQVGRLLALRPPRSWPQAAGLSLALLVAIYLLTFALTPLLQPGEEQGLAPSRWDPSRAAAFAASSAVIILLAPAVEELTYRGLGYSLLAPVSPVGAALAIGLAFGLAHGLLAALPVLAAFGAGLALLRKRTGSVYPCILVHAVFNAIALVSSLAL